HRTGFPSARQRHHHAAVHWGQHRPLCVFHTAGCRLPGLRLHPGGRCLQHVVPRLCFTRHSLSRRAVSRLCRHCRGSSTVTSIPSSGVLNMTLLSYRSRVRKHLSAATLALGLALACSAPAVAATNMNHVLNWKYECAQAWFFLAEDKGYFKEQGLNVTIDQGEGSAASIPKVASGIYHAGFGDTNALIQLASTQPERAPVGVYMIYITPPFVIAVKADSPIKEPKDVEGKIIGAPANDAALK